MKIQAEQEPDLTAREINGRFEAIDKRLEILERYCTDTPRTEPKFRWHFGAIVGRCNSKQTMFYSGPTTW